MHLVAPDRLYRPTHHKQTRTAMQPGYIPVAGLRARSLLSSACRSWYMPQLVRQPMPQTQRKLPPSDVVMVFPYKVPASQLPSTCGKTWQNCCRSHTVESTALCLPTGSSVARSSPRVLSASRDEHLSSHPLSTQTV